MSGPPVKERRFGVIALAGGAALLIALASLPPFYLVWRGFETLAHDAARSDMRRLMGVVDAAASRQADAAREWARRASRYAQTGDAPAQVVGAAALRDADDGSAEVDLAAIVSSDRQVRAAITFAADRTPATPPPGFVPGKQAADFTAVVQGLEGVPAISRARVGGELFVLAAVPLTPQESGGRDALVLGRRVDASMLSAAAREIGVEVAVKPIAGGDAGPLASRLASGEIATARVPGEEESSITAHGVLTDDGGRPVVLLEMRHSGFALEQGRESLLVVVAAVCGAAALMLAIGGFLSRRLMLVPNDAGGETSATNLFGTDTDSDLEMGSRTLIDDDLTGIANRFSFDDRLKVEWNRSRRRGLPLSCLLVDVDFFDRYTKQLGVTAGRDCLRKVARAISHELLRSGDFSARYGGAQFGGVLPDTDLAGVTAVAKRVHTAIAKLELPHPDSPAGERVTVSVGGACIEATRDGSPLVLIRLADAALYAARDAGHDRVVLRTDEPGAAP